MLEKAQKEEYFPYLTDEMIEKQAMADLIKFQQISSKTLTFPIYADEILSLVWGVSVGYEERVLSPEGEVVLACFEPSTNRVRISTSMRGVEGRTSFTLAHEAGHVSLHNFLAHLRQEKALCRSASGAQKEIILERQVDKYATALLMPREEFIRQLKKRGYNAGQKFNLSLYAKSLKEFFGVSHQALEIRMGGLGVETTGGYYKNKPKKSKRDFYAEQDEKRSYWTFDSRRT